MSENPYQAPVPNSPITSANRAPGALKTICILCIILGTLGLFGSIIGIGGLIFQERIYEFQMDMADPSQHEMQTRMVEAQASFFIPSMILAICNLFIAPLLLVGGIGVLIKKRWGQNILSLGLISATIFVLVRVVSYSFFQLQVFGIMKESILENIKIGPGAVPPAEGTMQTVMMTSMYVGVGLGIVMALAYAAFYFWGWRYLKKDSCQEYLSTFPS